MATEVTQTLAKFAATLRYDDLPDRAREHCKNLLLDALACAVAGRLGEETSQVAAFAAALAQGREASVVGDRCRLPAQHCSTPTSSPQSPCAMSIGRR
jgi:2-methylcitrate dehydratase PrpD